MWVSVARGSLLQHHCTVMLPGPASCGVDTFVGDCSRAAASSAQPAAQHARALVLVTTKTPPRILRAGKGVYASGQQSATVSCNPYIPLTA